MTRSWLGVLAIGALAACSAMGGSPKTDINDAAIHYSMAGSGKPVVVFDAGAGDDMETWSKVYGAVSDITTALAFDRPGYGSHFGLDETFDTDRDGVRTSEEIAGHIRLMLQAAGQKPPYVLVGHSLGGLNMLAYAKRFPDEVAGLVLVDSRPPGFTALAREAGRSSYTVPKWMIVTLEHPIKAEVRGLEESEVFADDPSAYGNIPVIVLAAKKSSSPLASRDDQAFWVSTQRAFAASLANGKFAAIDSGHYIHRSKPEVVIDAIRELVEASVRDQ